MFHMKRKALVLAAFVVLAGVAFAVNYTVLTYLDVTGGFKAASVQIGRTNGTALTLVKVGTLELSSATTGSLSLTGVTASSKVFANKVSGTSTTYI